MLRMIAAAIILLAVPAAMADDRNYTRNPGTILAQTAQSWSCQPRRTCGQIRSCEEAYWYLRNCSWGYRLDGDNDGVPCETICGRR